jgi:hypothetical protein
MSVQKPTSPVKATTQQFIEIEEIQDDIVLLKDYSAVLVIEISAVNFWLLSSEEQMSIIYAYGSLLNSLSFPLQILILSKKWIFPTILIILIKELKKQTMRF